ncbi:hypothetical protein BDQ12DRAFT_691919 [Crucibulum laeve]|uniref:Uncharacterized protein n=1 Tax=Crucibulum laeve TaxID=68775 RepID=A0A5C3LJ71_9AGAR|nr:hypothetical protein BDQ12DRAFT_691919 [Crucibulum laeve]
MLRWSNLGAFPIVFLLFRTWYIFKLAAMFKSMNRGVPSLRKCPSPLLLLVTKNSPLLLLFA